MTTSDLFNSASAQALYQQILELQSAVEQAKMKRKGAHNSFLSNTDRLKIFIDSNIMAVHRGDVHGNFLEVNEATVKLLGYKKEEFDAGTVKWTDITPPEFRAVDALAIRQLKERGYTDCLHKEYIRKDGTRIPVMLSITSSDSSGNDCITFVHDLSERKKIEKELADSEAKFRILADAIPQVVWMGYTSGRMKYCNQRFYDYTGLKREDDDGLMWLNVIHPADKSRCLSDAQRAADTEEPFECEFRYRDKDGNYRWHLVRAVLVKEPKSGRRFWVGTSTDIENQKRVAEELRESEAQFSTLADAIPQIVFTADSQGNFDFFNQRWFEYTGLTEEQSKNHGWELLIHPDDLPRYLTGWNQSLNTGDSYEVEFRLKRVVGLQNGAKPYRWHLGRAVALQHKDGSVHKWFATWTEIEGQQKS